MWIPHFGIHHARCSSTTSQTFLSDISIHSHTLRSHSSLGFTKYPQVCFLTTDSLQVLRKPYHRNPTRSWRPRTSWTIKRTILIKLIRQLIKAVALYISNPCRYHCAISQQVLNSAGPLTKTPNHRAITPGKNVQGVWVEAASHLITGDLKVWADTANVSSVRVPGYWTHKKGTSINVTSSPQPSEKVVYSLHGGGYVHESAHPSNLTSAIGRGLLQHVEPITRVFSLEYRLAIGKPKPAHPFPSQLLDALAGYNYLV